MKTKKVIEAGKILRVDHDKTRIHVTYERGDGAQMISYKIPVWFDYIMQNGFTI